MQFLRQSWNSDYCGVYAAGMFLSLLGHPLDRPAARKLFGLRGASGVFDGTTPAELLAALRGSGTVLRPHWRFFRRFELKAIQRHFTRAPTRAMLPSILYFGIIHRRRGERAMHYSVITACGHYGLRLLDPLGREPKVQAHNVSILENFRAPGHLATVGCGYLVDTRIEAGLLLWEEP